MYVVSFFLFNGDICYSYLRLKNTLYGTLKKNKKQVLGHVLLATISLFY